MEKATSVRRAVELLIALADDEALANDGRGVNRLAEVLSDDKSRVPRTMQTLQEYGAALNVPGAAFRFEGRLSEAGERLRAAAGDLAAAVGRRPRPGVEMVGYR